MTSEWQNIQNRDENFKYVLSVQNENKTLNVNVYSFKIRRATFDQIRQKLFYFSTRLTSTVKNHAESERRSWRPGTFQGEKGGKDARRQKGGGAGRRRRRRQGAQGAGASAVPGGGLQEEAGPDGLSLQVRPLLLSSPQARGTYMWGARPFPETFHRLVALLKERVRNVRCDWQVKFASYSTKT